jgi:hypothetical protein
MDFLTSVGIRFGFWLKCRFSVGNGFGFGIEKSHWFFSGFFRFVSFFRKSFFGGFDGHVTVLSLVTLTWLS